MGNDAERLSGNIDNLARFITEQIGLAMGSLRATSDLSETDILNVGMNSLVSSLSNFMFHFGADTESVQRVAKTLINQFDLLQSYKEPDEVVH